MSIKIGHVKSNNYEDLIMYVLSMYSSLKHHLLTYNCLSYLSTAKTLYKILCYELSYIQNNQLRIHKMSFIRFLFTIRELLFNFNFK